MLAWHYTEVPGEPMWGEVPEPELGDHDVRVTIVASGVNHIDHWIRLGRPKPPRLPHVPGVDGVGVISEVGSNVTSRAVGDEVVVAPIVTSHEALTELGVDSIFDPSFEIVGEHRWGCHGHNVVVPAESVITKPTHVSWLTCAAYPVAYGTAYRMLRRGRCTENDVLLVTGIGGGVSTALLNLAVHMGIETHVTSRDPQKLEVAKTLGATVGYLSDDEYPAAFTVIADSIGPAIWDRAMKALRPGGRFVTCGATTGQHVDLAIPRLFFKQHEIIGSTMASVSEVQEVTNLVDSGLEVTVDDVIALDAYPAAIERIVDGRQFGKIVIDHQLSIDNVH